MTRMPFECNPCYWSARPQCSVSTFPFIQPEQRLHHFIPASWTHLRPFIAAPDRFHCAASLRPMRSHPDEFTSSHESDALSILAHLEPHSPHLEVKALQSPSGHGPKLLMNRGMLPPNHQPPLRWSSTTSDCLVSAASRRYQIRCTCPQTKALRRRMNVLNSPDQALNEYRTCRTDTKRPSVLGFLVLPPLDGLPSH